MKKDRVYAISERQLEQLATCLRMIDRARNRLAVGRPENAELCEKLTKCSHSLYELTNHVRAQSIDSSHGSSAFE